MNKSQLVDAIAKEAAITKVEAKKALDAFIAVTGTALKSGDKIALVGFGSFSVAKKPGRPQCGRGKERGALRQPLFLFAVSEKTGNLCSRKS